MTDELSRKVPLDPNIPWTVHFAKPTSKLQILEDISELIQMLEYPNLIKVTDNNLQDLVSLFIATITMPRIIQKYNITTISSIATLKLLRNFIMTLQPASLTSKKLLNVWSLREILLFIAQHIDTTEERQQFSSRLYTIFDMTLCVVRKWYFPFCIVCK